MHSEINESYIDKVGCVWSVYFKQTVPLIELHLHLCLADVFISYSETA